MMDVPAAIVERLDELELYSDDPVRVVRLTGELRELLALWAEDEHRFLTGHLRNLRDVRALIGEMTE